MSASTTQHLFANLSDPTRWLAVASGQGELHLTAQGSALRLDFDFHGGGGFVVARRLIELEMPESFLIKLRVRGECPSNHFELKLEDLTRRNVWRWTEKDFNFPPDGQVLAIRRRDIEFAWVPQGGGAIQKVGAVEFAIVAGQGGEGTVWIEEVELEDQTIRVPPMASASSSVLDQGAELPLNKNAISCWRSASRDLKPWWQVNFQGVRELGGLVIRLAKGHAAKGFFVEISTDAETWEIVHRTEATVGGTSYVRIPDRDTRILRLRFDTLLEGEQCAVQSVEVKPLEFGRTVADFIHAVAAEVPRGWFPRYWQREQSYWTPVATPDGGPSALINEEGLVEVDDGSFSLEPFLFSEGQLITWADAKTNVALEGGELPLPSVTWSLDGLGLQVSACVIGRPNRTKLYLRYRITNPTVTKKTLRLFLVARPFEVTPPWQSFREFGGISPVHQIRRDEESVRVNNRKELRWSRSPSAFGALPFSHGILMDQLALGLLPEAQEAADEEGLASAVLAWDLTVHPSEREDIELILPMGKAKRRRAETLQAKDSFASAAKTWRAALGSWNVQLPELRFDLLSTWKTSIGHILINRSGPAMQPGPRRYTRCWIRDAAGMSAALLRAGHHREVAELLRWYATFQRADGLIPCCVDREGPDWLLEYDSLGQFIFTLHEHYRFTRDLPLVKELWPVIERALDCLEQLRKTRMTSEYRAPDKLARFGLMPESVSHEGYLAHPVHAYWDDFWDLRGLRDAASLAEVLGDKTQMKRLQSLSADFEQTLSDSMRTTIHDRQLDYVPGSVEWADFDPTATSNAIALLDELPSVSKELLKSTYVKYLTGFRDRVAGRVDWANYTAYEIRIVTALVRLGQREDALELLRFLLSDRRPLAWNQWPELSWRDPHSPGHIGDVPHTWISSEYAQAARSLFVFEHDRDQSLVLAAGVPMAWLDDTGVRVTKLPTPYGLLSYTLRRTGMNEIRMRLFKGLTVPKGGLVIESPIPGQLLTCTVNGSTIPITEDGKIVVRECPARIVISWSPLELTPPLT